MDRDDLDGDTVEYYMTINRESAEWLLEQYPAADTWQEATRAAINDAVDFRRRFRIRDERDDDED